MTEQLPLRGPTLSLASDRGRLRNFSAYFALKSGGVIEKLKLIKLIIFRERFLSEYHHPMLFDELYSLPHGPICSSTLNGIDGIIHDGDVE